MTCFHRNKNDIIKCKNQTLKQIRYHDAKDSNPQTGLSLLLKEF
jgi:hypothetical protein